MQRDKTGKKKKGEGRVKRNRHLRQPARMVSAISLLMVTFEAPSAAPRMYAFLSFSHLTMIAVWFGVNVVRSGYVVDECECADFWLCFV
jgi:hypothetical protein